jgi:ribosomal protein L7/L12
MRTSSEIYGTIIESLVNQVRDAEYDRDNYKTDLAYVSRELDAERARPARGADEVAVATLLWQRGADFYAEKKIHFIKDVRHISGCGLKEAKDAVEGVMGR